VQAANTPAIIACIKAMISFGCGAYEHESATAAVIKKQTSWFISLTNNLKHDIVCLLCFPFRTLLIATMDLQRKMLNRQIIRSILL
jgi:hypothetical protein